METVLDPILEPVKSDKSRYPLLHCYDAISNQDIALCGYRKKGNGRIANSNASMDRCVVCWEMFKSGKYYE